MNPSLRKETGNVLQEKQPIQKIEICIDKREQINNQFLQHYFLGRSAKKNFFLCHKWIMKGVNI